MNRRVSHLIYLDKLPHADSWKKYSVSQEIRKNAYTFSKFSAKLYQNREDNTLSLLESPNKAYITVEEYHLEAFLDDWICTFVAQSSKNLSILDGLINNITDRLVYGL